MRRDPGLAADQVRRRRPDTRATIRAHRDLQSEYPSQTAADGRAGNLRSAPGVVLRR